MFGFKFRIPVTQVAGIFLLANISFFWICSHLFNVEACFKILQT